ncbi:MAG: LysR family transcriptional regulator [Ruminococcaceae bacterium]|nr:LysR family transcriptional regulator [Oscillospiraceae bacterium]
MFRFNEYVYEVYKERSFSKAAHNLHISQPSLSAKIIKLENELGLPIFDRSTSPLRLTEFGEFYIEAVEEQMKLEAQVKNYLGDLHSLKTGQLSIGASNVFAACALPPIITAFRSAFPNVNIRLTEGNTEGLEQMLSANELDLVIDNNRYDAALYAKELYGVEHILLAVPRGFDVCKATEAYQISEKALKSRAYLKKNFPAAPLSLFKDIPFVMLTQGNDTRLRGDRLCRDAGFRPKIVFDLNQQATAYMVASTGIGATFVSDAVAEKLPAHENLAYYKLAGESAERQVYFYYKKHKYKTRAMEEFIRLITRK